MYIHVAPVCQVFILSGLPSMLPPNGFLPCCIPVVVGAWLAACVRVVFGVNQVPMGVAVTATVFLLPTSTFVAVVHRFVVVHRFYKVFDLSIFCFDLVAEFFHRVG